MHQNIKQQYTLKYGFILEIANPSPKISYDFEEKCVRIWTTNKEYEEYMLWLDKQEYDKKIKSRDDLRVASLIRWNQNHMYYVDGSGTTRSMKIIMKSEKPWIEPENYEVRK